MLPVLVSGHVPAEVAVAVSAAGSVIVTCPLPVQPVALVAVTAYVPADNDVAVAPV